MSSAPTKASMGDTTAVQLRKPGTGFQRDPDRHYVEVEKDSPYVPHYQSPIHTMLNWPSKTGDGPMYRVESEDPHVTGNGRIVLLSCSKKDHEATLAEATAISNERKKTMKATKEEFETVEVSDSPALSMKDLQKAVQADAGN